jgi:RNA polymerase sigma factor (sigma-70 family)
VPLDPDATREALARLYPPLAPALVAWASLRLSPAMRRVVAPEDLAQEVWLRCFEVFDSFDADRTGFRAWLFAVAKRVLLEAQRRSMRLGRELAADGSSTRVLALHGLPDDVTSLTRRVSRDERVHDFVQRLADLDEKERMTVIHVGLEELSLTEAAQRLGESHEATGKRMQRLRERMRGWAGALDLIGGA